MGIDAISPSRISYTVRELSPRKYSSNLQDFSNSVDTVNFSGGEDNSEKTDVKPEKKQYSNLAKGIFLAVGTAIVATGVWFLTRGRNGKEAAKAVGEAAETIASSTQKAASEAAEIIVEASPKGADDVAEVIVENTPKSAEEIAEVVEELPSRSTEILETVVDDSSAGAIIPKKSGKKSNRAEKTKANILPESQKKPVKTRDEELKPENNDIPTAIILASDDITSGSEKFAGKVKAITENVENPKLPSDDIVDLTDEIPQRGIFGQDLNDPLDPRNADDIMSPYYKEKGVFGQDLNDPLDPRNEDDIMSPYYKDRTLEAVDDVDDPIIDIVEDSIGF